MRARCAFVVAAFASLLAPAASAREDVVMTASGEVAGRIEKDVRVFRGIPYAEAPVGDLRWRAPRPAAAWTGRRDATHFAPSCPQPDPKPFGPYSAAFMPASELSEDCLYLNIWSPDGGGKRPVYLFIHGGAFVGGGSNAAVYDGAELARKGAVVVTINYRLGLLGFMAHPELARESPLGTSGNYGLLDAIEALRWVRDNIARFGGDPANVTVAGQSAGSALVNDLLVSPLASGLFHRAVLQSGPELGIPGPSYATAEALGSATVARAGVKDIAGLRAAPVETILKSAVGFPLPVADGKVIPASPENMATPLASPVPLIIGFTRDESAAADGPQTVGAFEAEVRKRFGDLAPRALALYPHGTDAEAARSGVRIARDRRIAGLILWAEARAAQGVPVFSYHFEHPFPGSDPDAFGAFHTGDLPYVFGNLDISDAHFTGKDRALSRLVQDHWLAFIKTGDPGSARSKPRWRRAGADPATIWRIGQADSEPLIDPARLALFRDHKAKGGTLGIF
jgi:para-nitrobenzyl esterase